MKKKKIIYGILIGALIVCLVGIIVLRFIPKNNKLEARAEEQVILYQPADDYVWYYIFSIELYGNDTYYLIIWRKTELGTLMGSPGDSYGGKRVTSSAHTLKTDAMVSDEQYSSIEDAIAALKSSDTKYHEPTETLRIIEPRKKRRVPIIRTFLSDDPTAQNKSSFQTI